MHKISVSLTLHSFLGHTISIASVLLLGITSNPSCIECFEEISQKCRKIFKEKGWSGVNADPSLQELTKMVLELLSNIMEKNEDSIYQELSNISEKSTQKFTAAKHLKAKDE